MKRKRIAVIGSGISGLSSAYILSKSHDVSLFETKGSLGLGGEGKSLMAAAGKELRIDIPPRVTHVKHYPMFFDLLRQLNIETYPIKQAPSFSFHEGPSYLSMWTRNILGRTITLPFKSRKKTNLLWLYRHGFDLTKFIAQLYLPDAFKEGETIREYLQDRHDESFINEFIYPMITLMCTCTYEQLDQFPAEDIIPMVRRFFGSIESRRLRGGTLAMEEQLKKPVRTITLATPIRQIARRDQEAIIYADGQEAAFDFVVVATNPIQASHFAKSIASQGDDHALLKTVKTHANRMVLHRDTSLLPKDKNVWAPVNLFYDPKRNASSATMWMNPIDEGFREDRMLLQSWDPLSTPDEASVIAEASFNRSLVTFESKKAMRSLRQLMATDTERRLFFAGTYVMDGVPLLENGVASAYFVANAIQRMVELEHRT